MQKRTIDNNMSVLIKIKKLKKLKKQQMKTRLNGEKTSFEKRKHILRNVKRDKILADEEKTQNT